MPANRTAGFVAAGVTTDASVTSHAVFGEVYIDITPELSVLGGIRYTKDDKSIRTASGTFALGPFFEGEASFDAWTGRGSVTWQPTPDNNLYLTFSRGFKSGGFNPGNVGTPNFDSEFINSWELGSKNTLLDSKLTLNGALFQYDYSNLIVGNIVGTLATNVNIPETRVRGFELETVFTPLEGLRLEGALGLLKTDIRSDFRSSDPSRGGAFFQIQGNELPNAPSRTLKLAAEYNIPVAGSWSLKPRVDYYSQTGFWAREFNVAADRVGSWEQLDLQMQVAHDERDLALIFYVKNVQNNDDITFLEVNSNLVGSFRSAFLLDPRVYGVNLRVGF
jgi:outer membrane receptor protein involved in Fe transport